MGNDENKLVDLYKRFIYIAGDYKKCEEFLENIPEEYLNTDAIVHILNALSIHKNNIRNWSDFVILSEKILTEEHGEEIAKDLLKVII